MPIQHAFTQTIVDGTNTALVRPSDWNSSHIQNWSLSGNTSGVSNVSGTDIILQGGSNITLSGNSNTIIILGQPASPNTIGISTLSASSGTSGVVSGAGAQYVFAGGNNITLSQSLNADSATITVIGPTLPNLNTISVFEPFPLGIFTTANFSSLFNKSMYLQPFDIWQPVSISAIELIASCKATSAATASQVAVISMNVALYTRNQNLTYRIDSIFTTQITGQISLNSTTSIGISWGNISTSVTNGTNGTSIINGVRLITIPFATSLTAGEYWLAYMNSSTNTGSSLALAVSMLIATHSVNTFGYPGVIGPGGIIPLPRRMGNYSSTISAFPATLSMGDMLGATTQSLLYFNFQNYNIT